MKYLKRFESIEFEEEIIEDLEDFFLSEIVEETEIKKKNLILTISSDKLICPSCGNQQSTINEHDIITTDCDNCGLEVIYPSDELYIEDAWLKPQDLVITEPIKKYKYFNYFIKDGIGQIGVESLKDIFTIESEYLDPIKELDRKQINHLNQILKKYNMEIFYILSGSGKKQYFIVNQNDIDDLSRKIIEPRFVNELEIVI